MSNLLSTVDRALLHLRATANLIHATEVTTGARDFKASKEAPVPYPNLGTQKRTHQTNPRPTTDKPKENKENIPKKRNRTSDCTDVTVENERGAEGETDGNTDSNAEREGETDTHERVQ